MIPLRSPRSRRVATLRIIAVGIAAMLGMLTTPSHARAQKALVYCPVGIDVAGCTNLVAALQPVFPSGVDRGYDGSGGTVDLRAANLWGYSLIAVPSLATTGGATPYAILSDTAMGSRLHDAVLGRVALWSGTPDLGSPNGTQKDTLIQNLGRWAAASYGAVKGPGLVVFQDMSDSIATQYGWLHVIAGTAIQGDSTVSTHATVQGVTPTGTSLLRDPSGNAIAYANMAAFGFLLPGSGSGFTVDGVAVSGAGTQNVLLTSLGGNTGSATIATDADDYAPGTIVTITGSGFGPGETVTISLHERPFFDTPATITAVADKVGSFVDRSFSPDSADLDVRFVATAVGTSSGLRAVTTFTDAAPSTVVVQTQTPAPVISGSDATFVVFVKMGGNTGSCTAGLSATPSSNPAWPGTGVTFTFNPASVTGVSNQLIPTTLTVHTPPAMSPNTYHFSVSASGACQGNGTQTASGNGDLIVAPAVVTGNATISSSTSTSTFGQSVTFTATVTPASGTSTPTGSIQFLDNGTNLGAAVPLAGGVANVSTATLGAGSHTISATYTPGTGFAAGSVSSLTQTVNKATPSITWGVPSAVNYGTALSAAQLNATANPGAGTFTYTPAPGALLDAGTQTLSVTFTPTDGADYNPASTSVALTVNRLAATVTADNQTRVFGQPNPTLTGALTGFLPADNISATYATTATPTSDVGNYAITPTLVDPNGRLGNYAVTPAAGTLRIDKADQTISFAQPADPTFGESPVTLAATASSGLPVAFGATGACTVSGSSLSIGGAGSCVVTASQSGDQNHNGAPNVVYTLTVKKAAPSVSAQGGAFTYDGLTHAATVGATGVGGAALTPVTVTYNGSSMLPKNAGTYTVLVSFAGSSDYLAGSANATITIGQKALTVTADDKSKVYGGATPSFTATYAGFVTGEGPADLSGSVTFGGTATSAVDAGTYTIAPSGVTSQNYAITFGNGTLIISKAPLSVKAADQSRVYGDPDPAFTGTLTGVVNNDNITATYATTAALGSDIGSYPVTPTLVDPSSRLPNYSVASTDGVLTITKAPLTIAASSATRLYGGANPAFTGTITGTKNGDAITASYSTNATPLDNVGSYAIVPAAVDPSPSRIGNYAVTLTNGTLSITPAPLTVAANASTKVYGDANPSFSVTYTGFVNSEAASVLGGTLAFTTAANNTTGVGSVSVTPSGLTSTNYDVTFTAGQLTITPAPLTITAGNANRLYGAMNPTFTGSITGIKNGDAIAATYATAATAATDVGTYPIVPTAVDANPAKLLNYSVAVTNGTLTINPAPLSVTPTNASVIQGDHLPALLGVVAGIVNGDPITASYATTAVTLPYVSSAAGPYDITASLVDPNQRAGNYVVTLNKATLTILANAPPVLGTLTAPSAPVQIGTAITASATFTDVDVTASTPYPSSIDWGDGQTTSGPLDAPGTVTGTHSYAAAGVYTIAISVADKINTSPVTHYFQYVVVYDPSAGFVTGGGWINSPPAACQLSSACAGATGKATFGFNARYQRGANTPDGSTEFQFQAGGLNFKSTTYQWLVVAGSKAQYKGVGSINGKGAYNFLLTAIDGDLQSGKADAFRIKITDSSTGSVVYDNQMGSDDTSSNATVLGGGSIVIHP